MTTNPGRSMASAWLVARLVPWRAMPLLPYDRSQPKPTARTESETLLLG
jgi:hypothetical protein